MSTVLVVDDEETIREILRELFEPSHVYRAAETVAEAITCLQEMPFDVVLTDISLPDQSGVELLGHVRQIQPHTPVIIISGIDDTEYANGLIKMGAFGYLTKPFYLDDAWGMVERAIESRRFAIIQETPDGTLRPPRYEVQVEAHMSSVLVFDHEQNDDEDNEMLVIMGYTRDISESGLGIIVPEGSLDEQKVIGSTFHIVLGLDQGSLDIEAEAVRYQRLEAEKGHLIGAHITNMNGRDRVLFLQYLYMLSRKQ
jgi:YesN/AraC family two-component response regulator